MLPREHRRLPTRLRGTVRTVNDDEIAAGLARTPGYRYADHVGDQLFVAGQVPHDASGTLVGPGDPARQAGACLDNLRTVLEVHGFALADARRLTIYVVGDQQHLTDAWRGVVAWFGGEVPPATLLGIHLLGHIGQLVEIDAVVAASPVR